MADLPFAEVIGNPVEHSLSPDIHTYWLARLGISAAYRRHLCPLHELEAYLVGRRANPLWSGCNLTMPLKEAAARLLPISQRQSPDLGAINCVGRRGESLTGLNTDVDGVAAALGDADLRGSRAVVIGAGGAARAAVAELARRGARITILARSPLKAEPLRQIADLAILPVAQGPTALRGAAAVINATPLGMAGGEPMPPALLEALALSRGGVAVEMVYRPLVTPFLAHAAAAGLRTADGLTMLIGQARRPFELFFDAPPPPGDAELRALLLRKLRAD
jgi:shikimate dehydrogenase